MIFLNHGCYCSKISVIPSNWKTGGSIKKNWLVYYRFYDPKQKKEWPKGKLVPIKGMNAYKTLEERRDACRQIIADQEELLKERDYNPITGYIKDPETLIFDDYIIHPDTPHIEALTKALELKECTPGLKKDIRSVLKYYTKAAIQLRLDQLQISDVRRRHIKALMLQLGKIKGDKWTANNHNFYRAHLLIIFKDLISWETIDSNPVADMPKQKAVKNIRATLTDTQRIFIDKYLYENNYRFWLLLHLFFHTGCRETEIMRIKAKHVDLEKQLLTVTKRKGNCYYEETHTIKDIAVPLWHIAIKGANPDDFIFSRNLVPGPVSIAAAQITRRWNRWVKKKFKQIKADFYALKHLNTTEAIDMSTVEVAAAMNKESTNMINKHYDVKNAQRNHEKIKKLTNTFVPKKENAGHEHA